MELCLQPKAMPGEIAQAKITSLYDVISYEDVRVLDVRAKWTDDEVPVVTYRVFCLKDGTMATVTEKDLTRRS
jgi:hypothetical protein